MNFCPRCGTRRTENGRFCGKCGFNFETYVFAAPEPEPVTQPVTQPLTQFLVQPEPESEPEPVTQPVTQFLVQPEPESEPEPVTQPVTQPLTQFLVQPEPEPEPEPVIRPEPVVAPDASEIMRNYVETEIVAKRGKVAALTYSCSYLSKGNGVIGYGETGMQSGVLTYRCFGFEDRPSTAGAVVLSMYRSPSNSPDYENYNVKMEYYFTDESGNASLVYEYDTGYNLFCNDKLGFFTGTKEIAGKTYYIMYLTKSFLFADIRRQCWMDVIELDKERIGVVGSLYGKTMRNETIPEDGSAEKFAKLAEKAGLNELAGAFGNGRFDAPAQTEAEKLYSISSESTYDDAFAGAQAGTADGEKIAGYKLNIMMTE